jgi:hypothetical protein
LLSKRPFSAHDRDQSRRDLYSDEQLECLVQASTKEIASGLSALKAFSYNGCWRILSDDALEEIADAIQPYTVTDRFVNRFAAFTLETFSQPNEHQHLLGSSRRDQNPPIPSIRRVSF